MADHTIPVVATADGREPVPILALRASEAATALRISPRLLSRLTSEGAVPHARVGRVVLYPIAALEQWLADLAAEPGVAE